MNRLWTTFRYTFTRLRSQILGWGLGLGLFGLMIVAMYENLGSKTDQFQKMIETYPPEFLAFFGADQGTMLTPTGFLSMYAFSMFPLIVGIYAVMAGSGLIVSDEEHGRLDLIIAHPVGRISFFWGRALGLLGATLAIMIVGWLGFSILLGRSSLGFTWGQMAIPFISLFVQTFIFAALALLLSLLLPSRSLAGMVAGVFVVVSYFISSLAFLNERLEMVSRMLPYHYYQTVLLVSDLNPTWILSLFGASLLMTILAYLLFRGRDIRLSGEGSWRK